MKLFGFTLAAVSASPENRFQSENQAATITQYLGQRLFPMVTGADLATLFADMEQVMNYGCWCQLKTPDGVRQGVGAPMDAIDSACQEWHACMDCAVLDYECNTFPIPYEVGLDANGVITCENSANKKDCSITACKCDDKLVQLIAQHWFNRSSDYFIKYDGSDSFDYKSECKPLPPVPCTPNCLTCDYAVENAPAKQCCGTYPDRYPFSTASGCRQCCGDKTYNVDKQQCCDNTLAALGTCYNL